jgi:2-polyprenyl-3-methyl-5-hydroxy-6-metoxy-1,4-benzoquinol methylase
VTADSASHAGLLSNVRRRPDCPLCGAPGRRIYQELSDVLYGAPGHWSFRSCADDACGLLWLDPRPHDDDLPGAYVRYHTHDTPVGPRGAKTRPPGGWLGQSYLADRFQYPLAQGRRSAARFSKALTLLPRLAARLDDFVGHLSYEPDATLLDVGCGNGSFMQAMRALGWNVTGVEIDPRAAAVALTAGLEVHQGDLRTVDLPADHFSAIVMRHVFEHVSEPLATLRRCLALLRPGGRLVITTPNPDGLGHRIFRRAWRGLEPPRHLQLYRASSMRLYLVRAGFACVSMQSTLHWADGIVRQSVLIRFPALRRHLAGKALAAGVGAAVGQVELILRPIFQFCGEELLATGVRGCEGASGVVASGVAADEVAQEALELAPVDDPDSRRQQKRHD